MTSLLVDYFTPPSNYIGAFLFISYIVAALELTNFIVSNIFSLYESRTSKLPASRRPQPAHILFFASLAALSFAVLSYHMLSFLVQSYATWCNSKGLDPTLDIGTLMPKLGTWMTDSMLFTIFAQDLAGNEGGKEWLWTGVALAGMMAWGQWMGRYGRQRSVPNLWAYFVLGQILPTSFSQNLFFITLLCLPKSEPEKAKGKTSSADEASSSWLSMLGDFGLGCLFIVVLLSLPSAQTLPWFMDLVLVARMLLFAPFVLSGVGSSASRRPRFDPVWALMGGIVVGLGFMIFKLVFQDGESALDVVGAARSSPAVRALVDDTLIGVVSAGLWIGLGLNQDY